MKCRTCAISKSDTRAFVLLAPSKHAQIVALVARERYSLNNGSRECREKEYDEGQEKDDGQRRRGSQHCRVLHTSVGAGRGGEEGDGQTSVGGGLIIAILRSWQKVMLADGTASREEGRVRWRSRCDAVACRRLWSTRESRDR